MGNPVFGRADVFQPRHPQQSANHGSPAGEWGTSQPYLQGQGMVGAAAMGQPGGVDQPRQATMTLDDVIAKTGVVLLVLAAAAALTFSFVGTNLATAGTITVVTSLVSFVTVLIVSARRRVPVGGVMAYALVEGVFIGAFSAVFEAMYPGIVVQAALGTFAAAGVTLAVYSSPGSASPVGSAGSSRSQRSGLPVPCCSTSFSRCAGSTLASVTPVARSVA